MVKGGSPTEEELVLLHRAWPDEPVDEQIALLRSLPLLRREKAVARLKALLTIEAARRDNPRAHVDLKKVAADAGLTSDGLFAIRQKWAASRTLSALVPYLGRAERQPTQRADDDPVVVAARRLIVERPTASDSMIASALGREFDLSAPVLVRLVRRVRRDDATDPDRIGTVFGKAILVDVCAINRTTLDDDPQMIVCALVVERASGLMLGHHVAAANDDTLHAQLQAIGQAHEMVTRQRLDQPDGHAAALLTLGDGPGFDAAIASAALLKKSGVDLAVNSLGSRRYGSRVVSLLGKRLGRLWWRPRSSAPHAEVPAFGGDPAIDIDDARILVDGEVSSHNAGVLERLAEGGVRPGWGVAEGAMVGTLNVVADVLAGRIKLRSR